MAQAMRARGEGDLFKDEGGKPIRRLLAGEGNLQNAVLGLFSRHCTGKYADYLDNGRVEGFIGWFEKNWKRVQKNIEAAVGGGLFEGELRTKEQLYYALGFMVGGQYALGKYTDYGDEVDGRKVKLYAISGVASCSKWAGKVVIAMGLPARGKKPKGNSGFSGFLRGLNTGIHEYSHMLRYFNGIDGKYVNELGVSLASMDLLLPVYCGDIEDIADGVRDPVGLMEHIRSGKIGVDYAEIVGFEYLDFAVAPWVKAYFEKNGGKVPREFLLNCVYKSANVSESLRVLYRKDTVYRGKVHLANFNLEKYLESIPDKGVRDILSKVFGKLLEEHWKTPKEFLEKLFDALERGFGGRPPAAEVPEGFVYALPRREARNEFLG